MSDMFLARDGSTDYFDLAVGEPVFLQEIIPFKNYDSFYSRFNGHGVKNELGYPLLSGQPDLIEQIHKYHRHKYKYAVVANGAKQCLSAVFYAYSRLGRRMVEHEAPYWPSFPTLSELCNLEFTGSCGGSRSLNRVRVITSPNNPDGVENDNWCDVWDAAYGSDLYGKTKEPDHEVAIFSSSKLLGLSSFRVGWLCTDNPEIFKYASEYVEKTTSGVCVTSQNHLTMVLQFMNSTDHNRWFIKEARKSLLANGEIFTKTMGSYLEKIEGLPKTGTGMFAWFKVSDPKRFMDTLEYAKIRMVSGTAFGWTHKWFRMSCGQNNALTTIALNVLAGKLKNG